ncbi:unnamed protein product [marine sediment metagenome]|uniref:Uncharacterized protein n=1 Tax=marine sediment metagenome TaxID=412755 RepID=X1J6M9_9ZZZZ
MQAAGARDPPAAEGRPAVFQALATILLSLPPEESVALRDLLGSDHTERGERKWVGDSRPD